MPTNEYRDASADTTLDQPVVSSAALQAEVEQLRAELINTKEYARRLQKQMNESSLYNIMVQLHELKLIVIELRKELNNLSEKKALRDDYHGGLARKLRATLEEK